MSYFEQCKDGWCKVGALLKKIITTRKFISLEESKVGMQVMHDPKIMLYIPRYSTKSEASGIMGHLAEKFGSEWNTPKIIESLINTKMAQANMTVC